MSKEKYTHLVNLNSEQEARLNAQREKGRTIISLLMSGVEDAEKKE